MNRPTYIDISATSSRAPSSAGSARTGGRVSPRIHHYEGDIPPILSPLDAFAAESRRLAKELEAQRQRGQRRMSRLPPAVITKSLSQHQANRPACFRTLSGNATDEPVPPLPPTIETHVTAGSPEIKSPSRRPQSSYPRISAVSQDGSENDTHDTPINSTLSHQTPDYFDLRRTQSPTAISLPPSRSNTNDQITSAAVPQQNARTGLAPPNAAFLRKHHESSDDDYTSSNAGSTFSIIPRKTSNGSGTSFVHSPMIKTHERSSSNGSEESNTSNQNARVKYNFSRPLSQTSLNAAATSPNRTAPSRFLERKASHLSEEARNGPLSDDNRSVVSDGFVTGQASSYTHKKFTLPRGKLTEMAALRTSQLFSGLSTPDFSWQEPMFPGTPPLSANTESFEISSPVSTRPSRDNPMSPSAESAGFSFEFDPDRPTPIREVAEQISSSQTTSPKDKVSITLLQRPLASHSVHAAAYDRTKMHTLPPIPGSTSEYQSLNSMTKSEHSNSTVRPSTIRAHSDYQALSAEEHVEKAIALHQYGDLKESTYHFRIAANQNHPTGMLLYALACRHGWGMRANPTEGVRLLRQAMDTSMLEVAEDESPRSATDNVDKKNHRAQFALAIYELGISHLKGWGVPQDKPLALRCFELAGNWGDADALTEAGFCYAEGIGCKKDLKQAAKLYRAAAAKGVSMVGNSWIYKDKYNDDNDANAKKDKGRSRKNSGNDEKEKTPRNKSKTRSIFGRKRSNTAGNTGMIGMTSPVVQ